MAVIKLIYEIHVMYGQKNCQTYQTQIITSVKDIMTSNIYIRLDNFVKNWMLKVSQLVKSALYMNCMAQWAIHLCILGVKVWNMKMDFNTGGTWHWVGQWTLMMKIYDLFYSAKSFSHPIKYFAKIIAKMEYVLHNIIRGV